MNIHMDIDTKMILEIDMDIDIKMILEIDMDIDTNVEANTSIGNYEGPYSRDPPKISLSYGRNDFTSLPPSPQILAMTKRRLTNICPEPANWAAHRFGECPRAFVAAN